MVSIHHEIWRKFIGNRIGRSNGIRLFQRRFSYLIYSGPVTVNAKCHLQLIIQCLQSVYNMPAFHLCGIRMKWNPMCIARISPAVCLINIAKPFPRIVWISIINVVGFPTLIHTDHVFIFYFTNVEIPFDAHS